ncbi:MAG: YceI family protein [Bacteroidales bacterium]|nr:YceI family protein [Bacteroidales bacterium]
MKKLILFTIILIYFSNILAQNQLKLRNNPQKSFIKYAASHPLHDWEGISHKVIAIIITNTDKNMITAVAAKVKVSSFNSENSNRDSHMIEITDAIKYPYITFKSIKIEQKNDKLHFIGTLNFHGIEKKLESDAVFKKKKGTIFVSGNFPIKLSDFKIKRPALMGMEMDDILKISFNLVFE